MFNWYFNDYFIENKLLFYICLVIIILIVLATIYFVYKELKNNVNK